MAPPRKRTPLLAFGLVGALVFVLAIARLTVALVYADRIYPGVEAAGLDLSGVTLDRANLLLGHRLATYASQPLTIHVGDQQIQTTPADLGFRGDPAALTAAAYQAGRTGGPLRQLAGPLLAQYAARSSPDLGTIDRAALARAVARFAAQIDRPVQNARLVVGATVTIAPEQSGQTLDRSASIALLGAALVQQSAGPIRLPVSAAPAQITSAELAPLLPVAQNLLREQITLISADQHWTLDAVTLGPRLTVSGKPAALDLPLAAFSGVAAEAAAAVDRPARDASLLLTNGKVLVDADQAGESVDVPTTEAALREAVLTAAADANENPALSAVVHLTPANRTAAQLAPLAAADQATLDRGLVLTAQEDHRVLGAAALADLLTVQPSAAGSMRLQPDQTKVAALVAQFNQSFARPQPWVRFAWNNGKLALKAPPLPARQLDQPKAVAAIMAKWDSGEIDLPIVQTAPQLDDATLARISQDLKGVIGEAATSYAGSIPQRAHNVELAAQKLDGTVIAPGASFSFNDSVGPTTFDAGFEWGFAIQSGSSGAQTVPSVAGGICQVATTVFQPVFWAGYQIDERHWHDYWIEHYVSNGDPGLDATVDEDAGLDLKFTNDTSHYLLLKVWTDGSTLRASLIGTRPDWTVHVDAPQLTARVAAPTAVTQSQSPLWPKGTTIVTQARADGFQEAITRHVIYPDGHVRDLSIREVYAAVPTTVLIGTG
jgi:vancomycin resistance protein YoaR